MKTELNNTGILLADLNEIEIKLAIELYRLSIPEEEALTRSRSRLHSYIGIYCGGLGFLVGNGIDGMKPITLHQLAFESGINPDWADEVCIIDGKFSWVECGGRVLDISDEIVGSGCSTIIQKHTETEPKPQSDQVKNPSHYQFFDGVEVIEIIAKSMTVEQFKGYCLGNRLKYRLRAGNKDKLEQDIAKSDFYVELYEKHKHMCR